MRVTSAQAAKLLRQLNDELRALQLKQPPGDVSVLVSDAE